MADPAKTSPYEAALSLIDEAHAQDPTIAIVNGESIPYELHYAQRSTYWLNKHFDRSSSTTSSTTSSEPQSKQQQQQHTQPSPTLRVAVRAQHFRRWEIPRSAYPATKAGYFAWRTFLKRRQGDLTAAICRGVGVPEEECAHVAALIRKDDLKKAEWDEEVQVLEDVACLVFLDDQLEGFAFGKEGPAADAGDGRKGDEGDGDGDEKKELVKDGRGEGDGAWQGGIEVDEEKMIGILRKTWGKMGERGRELALGMQLSERGKELVAKALAG